MHDVWHGSPLCAGRIPGSSAAVPHLRGAGPEGRARLAGAGEADAENTQVRDSGDNTSGVVVYLLLVGEWSCCELE